MGVIGKALSIFIYNLMELNWFAIIFMVFFLLLISLEPIIKVQLLRSFKNKGHLWKFIKPGNLVSRLTAPAFLWASPSPRQTIRKLLPCNKSQTLCQLIKSTTDGYKFNWNESAAQQFPQTNGHGRTHPLYSDSQSSPPTDHIDVRLCLPLQNYKLPTANTKVV